jgi:YidC/Oxa1 family membrane protein insertase
MFSLFGVPTDAAYHLVAGFTGILTPVLGSVAAVAAIVAVTIVVRLVLMPLSFRALRGQAVQARLAPQLQALRQRYAKKPEQLQREMSALYKREGTSMFAGFAPLLLQWPLLSVIYLLFRSPRVGGKPNTLLSRDLFGVPLGTHWLSGAGPASGQGAVFLGVFALLAGLCWLSSRLARMMSAPPVSQKPNGKQAADPPAAAGAGALVKVLPYLTVVIAAFAPLAAGIYLLVSLGWSLAERRLFQHRSGAARIPEVKDA